MTSNPLSRSDSSQTLQWLSPFRSDRISGMLSVSADFLAVLIAASLPWSTTTTAIFVGLWLLVVTPTIRWPDYLHCCLTKAAFAFPFAFLLLAVLGVFWADAEWADRLHAIKPIAKLVVIPPLLYHFSRSERATWVAVAFLISCVLLAALSWVTLFDPSWKLTATLSDGVPVKNYIDQSQEFTLCAFALALPALNFWRAHRLAAAIACIALILFFVTNMIYVATARTALTCIPVLLGVFAWRYLSRKASLLLLTAAVVAAAIAWTTSPYLRQRIIHVSVEYKNERDDLTQASTARRLTYWRKSIESFLESPLFGHGTGSIKHQFERAASGQSNLDTEVVSNPHNQTLYVAVQWGILGLALLYGMWLAHMQLFIGRDIASWVGVVVVVQNMTSSLFNSHLADFHEGWIYVLGVGAIGGLVLRRSAN
ncbi:O-antigen ligase family protein [Bradyrhizobium arachidis]|uniref:O-antigen ligase family protein n=1 Tax=Bradyrhizobium arachidis TaxID=858423 RepID=UPI0021634F55|nr:O-antigen ligase family protein [Bradyrhizobium arachidis]UVO39194.1 O-antigen ligase family protein [Bradyrhizobium arachidis]